MVFIRWCVGCRRNRPFTESSHGTDTTVTLTRRCLTCHSVQVVIISPEGRTEINYTAPEYAQLGARNV